VSLSQEHEAHVVNGANPVGALKVASEQLQQTAKSFRPALLNGVIMVNSETLPCRAPFRPASCVTVAAATSRVRSGIPFSSATLPSSGALRSCSCWIFSSTVRA